MKSRKEEQILSEGFLKILEQIRILVKKRTRSHQFGEHTSWKSGGSLDFLDYRNYQAGDDPRYVDWNVFGRMNRLFVKLFQAEKDMSIHILIDSSSSMAFGNPAKDQYAKKIAAALSYLGLMNLDRVGIVNFDKTLGRVKTPEKGKHVYFSIIDSLHELESIGGTDLNTSLLEYLSRLKKPGFVFIISDFLDPFSFKQGLQAYGYGKFQVALIQVLSPAELDPVLQGYVRLKDVETGRFKRMQITESLLKSYKVRFNHHLKKLERFCAKSGFGYYLANTDTPFEEFLLRIFSEGRLTA
ncbi:DUF58 domain-containing protein [bacterium]|nr:DUF58 domain-containing protein [bacterium]